LKVGIRLAAWFKTKELKKTEVVDMLKARKLGWLKSFQLELLNGWKFETAGIVGLSDGPNLC
jgi:hypothetical protein